MNGVVIGQGGSAGSSEITDECSFLQLDKHQDVDAVRKLEYCCKLSHYYPLGEEG